MEGAPEARLYFIPRRMGPPGGFAQLRGAGVQGDIWRPRIHDEGDGTPSPMSFSMAAPSSSNQIWKDLDVISEDGQIDSDVQRAMAIHLVSARETVPTRAPIPDEAGRACMTRTVSAPIQLS